MSLKCKLCELKIKTKWAWQRVTRGYDDSAVWNINYWFLETMPKLLNKMIEEHCGHPTELTDKKWEAILIKMRDCFIEANEDTCTKENKYQKEYDQMWEDFTEQYGYFSDLLPEAEDKGEDGSVRMFMPSDKEINNKEWQSITKKFLAEDEKIAVYRDKKLHEGLDLFNKYFWNLWD